MWVGTLGFLWKIRMKMIRSLRLKTFLEKMCFLSESARFDSTLEKLTAYLCRFNGSVIQHKIAQSKCFRSTKRTRK